RRRDDEVAAVVEKIGRLDVRRPVDELQILRDAERAGHFTLDAEVAIEIELDAGAESVVGEARSLGVLALREERRTARNDRDYEGAGSRRRVLCLHLARSREHHRSNQHCHPTLHDDLLGLSCFPATVARASGCEQSGRSAIARSRLRGRFSRAVRTSAISSFWTMSGSAMWPSRKSDRSWRKVPDNLIEGNCERIHRRRRTRGLAAAGHRQLQRSRGAAQRTAP